MDAIFMMVVLTWLLTAMPHHANAADMNTSTTLFINSTQPSNEDCDLSLQQCNVIHGRSNDCYSKRSGQIKACARICNPDDYKQRCKRLCPEFTYTGKRCEGSMLTSIAITSTATTRVHNATTTDHYATATAMGLADTFTHHTAKESQVIVIVGLLFNLLALFMSTMAVWCYRKSMCESRGSIQRDVMECKEEVTRTSTRRHLGYDNGSFKQRGKLAEPEFSKLELDEDPTSVHIDNITPPDRKYEEDHANQLMKYLDKRGPMEGYYPIPDGIKQFISGVALEREVECGAIYQCPSHPKELQIIGMRASSMSDVIKRSMTQFPGYSFTILESPDPRHHVEFSGNDIFNVSKGVWQSGRDSATNRVLHQADRSQCGLILLGSAVRRNTLNAYYVVVPAHLVLEKELNESLLEATNTKTMEEMRKEVLSTADKTMYTLHMHNSTNTCDIQPIPLFAYRHFNPRESSEQRFDQFTNDLAILKIDSDQTRDQEQSGVIPLSSIVFAMQQKFGIASEEQATVIDDIFPLKYPDTLIEMARVGVRVLIGSEPIKGHLVPCGDPLSIDERTWSFAIEFITYSSELKEGDCGLILYVQDIREGNRLYPFGMFIGRSLRKHCCGQTIYRAVVLRQALNEIQSHYDHQVANLRPIGRADNRETNGADWVPDLRQLGEEEDLEFAACLLTANARSISGESAGHSGVSGVSSIHQASD